MILLKFHSYSEEWLDFILNCRSGRDTTDYDIVIGGACLRSEEALVKYLHFEGSKQV